MGWAAGITETLLQSHEGAIHLLPVLSESWRVGSIRGFRARGGYTVDMEWNNGVLMNAVIARPGGMTSACMVRYRDLRVTVNIPAGASLRLDGKLRKLELTFSQNE
jgi:alpha-L-fucosidase 2